MAAARAQFQGQYDFPQRKGPSGPKAASPPNIGMVSAEIDLPAIGPESTLQLDISGVFDPAVYNPQMYQGVAEWIGDGEGFAIPLFLTVAYDEAAGFERVVLLCHNHTVGGSDPSGRALVSFIPRGVAP